MAVTREKNDANDIQDRPTKQNKPNKPNMPNKPNKPNKHGLILEERCCLSLTGVVEVESFGEDAVFLYTELGELAIKGKNLEVGSFNGETGSLDVTGEICSVVYGEGVGRMPRNFISRLFR